mgnify:CR=1 FL=1
MVECDCIARSAAWIFPPRDLALEIEKAISPVLLRKICAAAAYHSFEQAAFILAVPLPCTCCQEEELPAIFAVSADGGRAQVRSEQGMSDAAWREPVYGLTMAMTPGSESADGTWSA